MQLWEFECLTYSEQDQIVYNAEPMLGRDTENGYIMLCQVDSFYIERHYEFGDDEELLLFIGFTAFDDTVFLDPYLEQIDISDLFS